MSSKPKGVLWCNSQIRSVLILLTSFPQGRTIKWNHLCTSTWPWSICNRCIFIIVGIIFILCFPSFQSRSVNSSENWGGGGHRTHSSTQVANSTMVADTNENSNSKPLKLPRRKGLIYQPSQPDLIHPLHPKLVLLLSCMQEQLESKLDYKSRLQPLSWTDCETVQKRNMSLISKDGSSTAVKGKWIPFSFCRNWGELPNWVVPNWCRIECN